MTEISKVLLALDASSFAEVATRYACDFSQRLGVPLNALHVLDSRSTTVSPMFEPSMGDLGPLQTSFDDSLWRVLEQRAENLKTRAHALLERFGAKTELELTSGVPADEILRRAEGHTLIVVGRAGDAATKATPFGVGSVAERVVRHTEGAVLMVPATYAQPKRIVLGFDDSSGARAALEYVATLAKTLGLPVLALSAARDENQAQRQLDTVRGRAERELFALETLASAKEPTEALLSATQTGDLLAIGAFGKNRFVELFRGSTTSDLVRGSSVPVLLHH